MGTARDLVFEILAIDGASHVFNKVGTSAEEAGAKVEASGGAFGKLASVGTMALAGMAAGAGLLGAKMIHMAADFQSGLTKLVTSAGESQKNLGLVGDGIKRISIESATSTKELTDGMYMIESAGFHGAAGLKVLQAAAEGARAEGAPLHEMGDALTTVMKDYHFSAGQATQATNGLIAIVAHGKTTMADLAGAIHNVAPYAKAAGISFAEMGGAISTMTMHGVSAQQATENLRHLIVKLQSPTQQSIDTMEQFGLKASDVSGKLGQRGLTGTLSLLVDAIGKKLGPDGMVMVDTFHKSQSAAQSLTQMLGGMPPELKSVATAFMNGQMGAKDYHKAIMEMPAAQASMGAQFGALVSKAQGFSSMLKSGTGASIPFQAALKKMLGDQTSLGVALQLTGQNFGDFKSNVAAVGDATAHAGKHVENWSTIQHTFNFKLDQFHQQLNVAGITIGTMLIPAVSKMMDVVTKIIPAISAAGMWLERDKPVAIGLAIAIGAALVPALWGMATAAWAAAAGFIAANLPLIAIAAALGLVVAGIMYAWNHFTWFREGMLAIFTGVKTGVLWVIDFVKQRWQLILIVVLGPLGLLVVGVVKYWRQISDGISAALSWIFGFVKQHWQLILDIVLGPLGVFIGLVIKYWRQIGDAIGFVFDKMLVPIFHGLIAIVKFVFETWWAYTKWFWKNVWDYFAQPIYKFFVSQIPEWLKTGYRLFDQYFIQPWKLAFTLLYQWIWTDFGQKIYNFFTSTLPGWFRQGVQNVKHAFGGFAQAVLVPVNWVIQNVWDGGIEKIWNAAAGVFGGPQLSPVPMLSVPAFAAGGPLPVQPGIFGQPTAIVGEGNPSYPEYVIPTDPKYRDRAVSLWAAAAGDLQMLAGGGVLGGIFGGLGSFLNPLKDMILGGLEKAASAAFAGLNVLLGKVPGAGTELGQLIISAVKTGEKDMLAFLHKKDQTAGGPVVGAAKSQLGVPYSWGGGGPDGPSYGFAQGAGIKGFDCSSLMQYAYWQGAHKLLPRTTYEQVGQGRAVASQADLLPGDLVFPYADLTHVMMVAAPGASGPAGMIEAPHTGASVRMNSFYAMDGGARRILGYRDGGFLGPGEIGLVGEVGPELITGGRSGATVHPIKGGDGSFMATIELKLDGQTIDRQLVKFQHVGGTLQSAQTEIKRGVTASARTI